MTFPMIRKLLIVLAAIAAVMPVPAMAERVRDLGQFHSVDGVIVHGQES